MIRLRVTEGGRERMVEVRGDRVVFGRLDTCDVTLSEPGVSRLHAELVLEGGSWVARDLGSSNGTFVNDEQVEECGFGPGDVLGVGPGVTVELSLEGPEDTRAQEPAAPRRSAPASREADLPPEPPAGRSRTALGLLRWLWRTRWTLTPRDPGAHPVTLRGSVTTVGRDPSAGLPLDDDSASRMHARLDRRHGTLAVTDLKSRNGTFVNGEPVLRAELGPGDIVAFGDASYLVARRVQPAWDRLGVVLAAAVVVALGVLGLVRLSDTLGQRATVSGAAERVRAQALEATRAGIEASRAGDPAMARTYLLRAADLLLLSDLAPRGATLDRPREFFRELVPRLPADEREFDFAAALDPATIEAAQAQLATMTNREYVEHQLSRYAAELGQDPHVPPGFVDQVWSFVDQYEKYPATMRTMLRRARDIQPRIRSILASRHLPEAFCYVAWVESGLDPMQQSGKGAVGLWQLMASTAREEGLRVDPSNLADDERTHVERSTEAAADYIAKLLRDQGPEYFMLVLASYNRGPAAVDRAKQKVADPMLPATRKYWYLVEHDLLPEETRNYVPKILAVRLIAEAPERFGFDAP